MAVSCYWQQLLSGPASSADVVSGAQGNVVDTDIVSLRLVAMGDQYMTLFIVPCISCCQVQHLSIMWERHSGEFAVMWALCVVPCNS